MKRILSIVLTAVLLVSLCACSSGSPTPSASGDTSSGAASPPSSPGTGEILSMGSGGTGGSFYAAAAVITKYFNESGMGTFTNEPSGGGRQNALQVQAGEYAFGTIDSRSTKEAYEGIGSYENSHCPDLRAVFNLYTCYYMQCASMDIESFDDLKGKTLQVGAPGSSDETHTRTLYGILGWEWEKDFTAQYMPGEQAIELFKDNMISGFVANANQPFAPFMEVFMDGRAKILDVPETALAALCDGPDALYIRATIPANTYDNQDYDVSTFCAKLVCVANASADEELIYQITKYVMEHAEDIASENAVLAEFNPEYCVSDINIPFHPGAERYYKEIGLL